jgi:hypothetical protein
MICSSRRGQTWHNIVSMLKETEAYGESMRLTCGLHPENDVDAIKPEDFDTRPNGGCTIPCKFQLLCGHICPMQCHTFDLDHTEYKCRKVCNTSMKCGHKCQKECWHTRETDCKSCTVKVEKFIPECGHTVLMRCDAQPTRKVCTHPCQKKIDKCGHLCVKQCRDLNCEPCRTQLDIQPPCKHAETIRVFCTLRPWEQRRKCVQKCNELLSCGHMCAERCGRCEGGTLHKKCNEECSIELFCGHKCQSGCSEPCLPCDTPCQNRCAHKKCSKKCSELCAPCGERCSNQCEHYKCSRLCHEICDRPTCDEPCKKVIACGHACIGNCGEPCPPFCRLCDSNKLIDFIPSNYILYILSFFHFLF